MPRLPRIRVAGAIYYVTSRAVQNEVIFKDKEDYRMYLELVNKYKGQHKFKLFSYCLLPDHLELLIEPGDDASISEIMHDLNSLYTKYFNGRYQKRGHLFESRFRSVLVEKAQLLAAMTRRIHRMAPKDHPYSSFHIYKGADSPAMSSLDLSAEIAEVTQFLREKDSETTYEKYVLEGDAKEIELLDKSLKRGQVVGSDGFRERVKRGVQKHVDELQKEDAAPAKSNPVLLFFIGGLVILATATSIYLYVSKAKIESQYEMLLKEKELEFNQKTKFENRSPLALADLEGTIWQIEAVRLPADKATQSQKDTLHFEGGKFYSEEYRRMGFAPTNITVSAQPNGLTTWETVQTNGGGDAVSWRGDWQGDVMKGVLNFRSAQGEVRDFSFYSLGWSYANEESRTVLAGGAQ